MRIFIRKPTLPELPMAKAVSTAAFESLRSIYRPTAETLARQPVRTRMGTRLIAILNGEIVGTVQYDCHEKHVHIIGLAVHPNHQKKGIARQLVQHIVDLAPGLGYNTVVLDTIRETGNVKIFQRMGFEVFEESITDDFESDQFPVLYEVKMKIRLKSGRR